MDILLGTIIWLVGIIAVWKSENAFTILNEMRRNEPW